MVRISDIIRAEFAEEDNKRDAGLKTPENIVRYDDIIYEQNLNGRNWMYIAKRMLRESFQ